MSSSTSEDGFTDHSHDGREISPLSLFGNHDDNESSAASFFTVEALRSLLIDESSGILAVLAFLLSTNPWRALNTSNTTRSLHGAVQSLLLDAQVMQEMSSYIGAMTPDESSCTSSPTSFMASSSPSQHAHKKEFQLPMMRAVVSCSVVVLQVWIHVWMCISIEGNQSFVPCMMP